MTMIEKLWRGCLSSQRMFFLFHRSHLQFFALLALGMLLGYDGFSASQNNGVEVDFWRARCQAQTTRENQLFPQTVLIGTAQSEASLYPS